MPELPEVETVSRDLAGRLVGRTIIGMKLRCARLRAAVSASLPRRVSGQQVVAVRRRAKYILVDFAHGSMVIHLGMSGTVRADQPDQPPRKHDHIEWRLATETLRYNDPRRFGMVFWTTEPSRHPALANSGIEPLTREFDGAWLRTLCAHRRTPIKNLLMDGRKIAGIGNIYAAEILFCAGLRPALPAGRLGPLRCARLATETKRVLCAAIRAGGSTLRDYSFGSGEQGWFQIRHNVYGRAGEACRICSRPIRRTIMANRATFYCPSCQSAR